MPVSCAHRLATVLLACALGACGGNQQGYYDACYEPAGLVLGCEAPVADDFTPWDACRKLAGCGVTWTQSEPDDDENTPLVFEACVDAIEDSEAAQGDVLLACIETSTCPELVQVDPEMTMEMDPNPAQPGIEGLIGYCGRLDPG